MKPFRYIFLAWIVVSVVFACYPKEAPCPWIWTPEAGSFVNEKDIAKSTPKEQYDFAKSFEKKKSYDEAIREYRKLLKNFPTSSLCVYAQIGIGECYEKNRDYYAAFKAYQEVLQNHPSYGRIYDIIEKQFKIGNLFLSGGKRRLWKFNIVPATDKAIEIFQQVIDNAPFSEFAPKAQFLLGDCYFKMKKYPDAILEYQRVVENYIDSDYVDDARFQIGLCAFRLSRGAEYDQQSTDKALKTFRSFIADYPQSKRVREAKKMISQLEGRKAQGIFDVAQYYKKLKQYDAAKIYYEDLIQNYPENSLAKKAKKALTEVDQLKKAQTASLEVEEKVE